MSRLHLHVFALALLTQVASAAAAPRTQDALIAAGPQAAHILDLWRLTLAICIIVFAAVFAAFAMALRRARPSGANTPPDMYSQHASEPQLTRRVGAAVVVSTLLLLVLITASVLTDRALARLPLGGALHIELTAHQWWWEARYDDPDPSRLFTTANELHIPVGRPIVITLRSDDVIHSFWVPSLAGKKDLIPGRTATVQLRADRAGEFRGQCAEFCGLQHAWMALPVTAEPPEAFEAWAAQQRQSAREPTDAQTQRGKQVFLGSTCPMCHAVQGTDAAARHGPDLTHVGSRPLLAAGALANTRKNLAAWIANPQEIKPGVNMPAHALAPDDLAAIASYLESLK